MPYKVAVDYSTKLPDEGIIVILVIALLDSHKPAFNAASAKVALFSFTPSADIDLYVEVEA